MERYDPALLGLFQQLGATGLGRGSQPGWSIPESRVVFRFRGTLD